MTKKRNWRKISTGIGLGLLTAAALGYAAYKLRNRHDAGLAQSRGVRHRYELAQVRRRMAKTNPRHLQRVINKEYKLMKLA